MVVELYLAEGVNSKLYLRVIYLLKLVLLFSTLCIVVA